MANAPPPIIVIKKVKGGHGHHGGAWKVAYADFVTAMMSLFMVLWLVSQTSEETKAEVSQYFRTGVFSGSSGVLSGSAYGIQGDIEAEEAAPMGEMGEEIGLRRAAAETLAALNKLAKHDPQTRLMLKNVIVKVTEEGLLVQILDGGAEMSFDRSSSALKPALVEVLDELGPILARLENKIQIQGHTDAKPFPEGSGRTNWALSFERADQARAVLIKAGLQESRISGVYAFGPSRLLLPNDPYAAANRRLTLLAVRRSRDKEIQAATDAVRKMTTDQLEKQNDEAKQAEEKPGEAKPGEAKPGETKPDAAKHDAAHDEAKPHGDAQKRDAPKTPAHDAPKHDEHH